MVVNQKSHAKICTFLSLFHNYTKVYLRGGMYEVKQHKEALV